MLKLIEYISPLAERIVSDIFNHNYEKRFTITHFIREHKTKIYKTNEEISTKVFVKWSDDFNGRISKNNEILIYLPYSPKTLNEKEIEKLRMIVYHELSHLVDPGFNDMSVEEIIRINTKYSHHNRKFEIIPNRLSLFFLTKDFKQTSQKSVFKYIDELLETYKTNRKELLKLLYKNNYPFKEIYENTN